MENFNFRNQGQSLIGIIIVLVVVGLMSSGLYYYFSKQIPKVPEIAEKPAEDKVITQEEITPLPKEGLPKEKGAAREEKASEEKITLPSEKELPKEERVILLVVEDALYEGLTPELNTYSDDIKREFGFETIFKTFSSSASIFEIKSYIRQVYNNYKLNSVLLIGNLPSGEFYISPSVFPEPALEDFIYQDIDNHCEYSKEKGVFEYSSSCTQPWRIRPFWISRLTPNSSSKSSLSLLKDYFGRNHAYRTGEYSYNQKSLVYIPLNLDEKDPQVRKDNELWYEKYLSFFDMYDKTNRNLIDVERENSDQLYLSEIKKPYEYEYFFYNGHGNPTFNQKNISPSNVLGSSFFLADFRSCSVGRFTSKDYLLGKYLFEGEGLVAMAFTVPMLGVLGEDPGKEMLYLLSIGEPLYEALKLQASNASLFGDPTLRMRYIKKPSSHRSEDPVINLDQTDFYFSNNQPKIDLKVKNLGESTLKISIDSKYYVFKEEWVGGLPRTVTGAGRDENYFYYLIAPNNEATFTFKFPFDNAPAGNYKGEIFILSNDPVRPYIIVPFGAAVK